MNNKLLLIILDGLGCAPKSNGNAVTLAQPANLTRYWSTYPHTYLLAAGTAVGLPHNTNGNSEVGHLTLGTGKVVFQNLPRINKSIEKGTFESNATLAKALEHAQSNNSNIHILGCLSDGSVHSHIEHFIAIQSYFAKNTFAGSLHYHAFTDGRDTPVKSAELYLRALQSEIDKSNKGQISSLIGRAYAMDRNETWDRTLKAYNLLTLGEGQEFQNWNSALQQYYSQNLTDEFIPATKLSSTTPFVPIKDNDVVIFMNFRSDRAIQLTNAFISDEFTAFPRQKLQNIFFAGMVEYQRNFPENVLFPKEYINQTLGSTIAEAGKRQLRIAESEKFPHVTYFFNGGVSIKNNGEDRIEIPSVSVPTYDQKPEMSTGEITQALLDRFKLGIYDFYVVNFANGDMVGHTGNIEASIKSIQIIDCYVDKLITAFTSIGGTVVITADHGNVEELLNTDTGMLDTEHSINPVPFIVIDNKFYGSTQLQMGSLADAGPTILHLMNINIPSQMTGKVLI